jgi:hypothetical protein
MGRAEPGETGLKSGGGVDPYDSTRAWRSPGNPQSRDQFA